MNKTLLSLSLVLAQALAVSAFAQSKGEVDPANAKATPSAKVTPAERAAAKKARKAAGTAAVKGETPDVTPEAKGVRKSATKAERAAARKTRRAAAADAVKKGETTSGELSK
jgi:hypothetical protein